LQLIFSGKEASQLAINEIGEVNIKLSKALYLMLTAITNQMVHLIDAATNTTAGVGFMKNQSSFFPEGRL
jgi:sulfate adenylyltransferase subunit 1